MIIFSRKTHGVVGETHHFRKPPKYAIRFGDFFHGEYLDKLF